MKGHAYKDLLLGFALGGAMSVPGVSGGTTAMAAGCYERVLDAAANPMRKKNFFFLLRLAVGGAIGFFTLARWIGICFRVVPLTLTLLFAGAAAGGLYPDTARILRQKPRGNDVLFFCFGVLCVIAVLRLPNGSSIPAIFYFPLGLLLAAGLILPGISTSHLLVVFGLYDSVTGIRSGEDLLRLLPLFCGVLIGVAAESRPLAAAMKRDPKGSFCAILGFACGSFVPLFTRCAEHPALKDHTALQAIGGVILCGLAFWGTARLRRENI